MYIYMKRPVRNEDGMYHIEGKKFKQLFGSREQVFNGTAFKTTGCLTKNSLHYNKRGRIVSLKKFNTSKKEMRLLKHGYGTKKGTFGFVRVKPTQTRKSSRSRKHHT